MTLTQNYISNLSDTSAGPVRGGVCKMTEDVFLSFYDLNDQIGRYQVQPGFPLFQFDKIDEPLHDGALYTRIIRITDVLALASWYTTIDSTLHFRKVDLAGRVLTLDTHTTHVPLFPDIISGTGTLTDSPNILYDGNDGLVVIYEGPGGNVGGPDPEYTAGYIVSANLSTMIFGTTKPIEAFTENPVWSTGFVGKKIRAGVLATGKVGIAYVNSLVGLTQGTRFVEVTITGSTTSIGTPFNIDSAVPTPLATTTDANTSQIAVNGTQYVTGWGNTWFEINGVTVTAISHATLLDGNVGATAYKNGLFHFVISQGNPSFNKVRIGSVSSGIFSEADEISVNDGPDWIEVLFRNDGAFFVVTHDTVVTMFSITGAVYDANYNLRRSTDPNMAAPISVFQGSLQTDVDTVPSGGVFYYQVESQG